MSTTAKIQGAISDVVLRSLLIAGFVFFTAVSALWVAPVSRFAVRICERQVIFGVTATLPMLVIWIIFMVRCLKTSDDVAVNPVAAAAEFLVMALTIYCLFVMLVTGGITHSPLTALSAVVPLLAGPIILPSKRGHLLWIYLIGAILIGLCSGIDYVKPPPQYPPNMGWDLAGRFDFVICTFIVASATAFELLLLPNGKDTPHSQRFGHESWPR